MNKYKIITKIAFAFIAVLFMAAVSKIVPENKFQPYTLELDSVWKHEDAQQDYWIDIDKDQSTDKVRHHNINISGHSVELIQGQKLNQIYIFRDNEQFIGNRFTFSDIDGDSISELLFVSVKNNTAYLNILRYRADTKLLYPTEKIVLDSVSRYDEKPDVVNNFIITSNSDIYLDLQGGYSVQPRNIYKYNVEQKNCIKTKLNSFVNPKVQHLNYGGQEFLLAAQVISTGNTISPKEAEGLRTSADKDTLEMYQTVKHLEYAYGDFASYVLLYTDNLEFAFEPIEFFGWTNFTKATLTEIDQTPHIVAFTNARLDEKENKRSKLVTVCNLQGKIVKQMPLAHNYSDIFSVSDKIIFHADKTLYLNNKHLQPLNEISDITNAYGFVDLNFDKKSEFIAFRNHTLIVFSEDFDTNATFKIEQEYAPYPEQTPIKTLNINNKHSFLFDTRLFYYLFSYKPNNLAGLKYPFYIAVALFIYAILNLTMRLNNKRLEYENKKLEKIVLERTGEIVAQKVEIEKQAEKINEQFENLQKLNQFKESLTHALVHDLKNPLTQMIANNQNEIVKLSAHKMMRLIMNMLDVEKYTQTQLRLQPEDISLTQLLENLSLELEPSLSEKNLRLKFNFANCIVRADKDSIVRVFDNLLSNAVRYAPLNSAIEIFADEISDNTLKICIKNFGAHILEENLPHVFEKYTNFGNADSSHRSTGLGLAFCKTVIEAHGHQIEAKNVPDGVVFSFTIDGKRSEQYHEQMSQNADKQQITLTTCELNTLKPNFGRLKIIEVAQISDISAILSEIPDDTENIKALKQNILNAVFASNAELYHELIEI